MSKNDTMLKKLNNSKNLKILFIASFFLFLLMTIRINWTNFLDIRQEATAKQGVMDLREVDTSTNFKIKLNGEWAFYPNTLLFSDHSGEPLKERGENYSNVPETWDQYFQNEEGIHYGTYRLRILKEHDVPQLYGIVIPESLSPYEIYVNGRLIGGLGDLAADYESSAPMSRPVTHYLMFDSSESEIVIQGIHSNPFTKGGMSKAIILGDLHSIEKAKLFSIMTQIVLCTILILYFFYTILLYVIGFRDKSLIFFSLLTFMTAITILLSHDRLLFTLIPHNWIFGNKIFLFSYLLGMLLFIVYIHTLIKDYSKLKIVNVLIFFYLTYLVFLLLAPIEYIYRTMFIFNAFYLISPIVVVALILFSVFKGRQGITFLLLTATAVTSNSITITLDQRSDLPGHYPLDILIAITSVSAFWFSRHFQTTLESKQLSSKLQKEMARKDDFLANTSHELRNPLHGIMNIAQTLLEKDGDKLEKDNKTNLQLLITISNHMSFMLDDLLDLVQLKEKTLHLQKRPINIHSVATGVCDMFHFMLQGKPIELLVKLPKDLPLVIADENRLIQIFSNFIHNAIKFTNEGSITIDAVVEKDYLSISIKDTGIGIDKLMLEKIFEPYEQVDPSMTSMGGGLGLGLSICREMITLHGGTISVSSTVGEGSTFTFTLPLANDATIEIDEHSSNDIEKMNGSSQYISLLNDYAQFEHEFAATTHINSQIMTSKPRILVVDDDAINLQVLINVLSTEAYEIDTALNGIEALAKLEANRFDLVISDIMMPHMSGYELAKRIRERFSIAELPILFLTARHQREDIYTGFLVGANDYVTKPMEYLELKARVHALIRVKQSSEERLRMEGAWLQAQIQPHFFFNTLSAIISLHHVDEDKMEELLLAFSDYLQTSFAFQNADLVVPIDYELKIVRSYITIEQIRFSDRINVIWDIPENIQLLVPPLSIQTLVENAIQHGILMRREGGTVQIRITESEEQFTISIIDNGKGFDHSAPKNRESVGLFNTSQRLKQLFDVELNIDSVLNKGTTISFSIPKNYKKRF